MLPQLIYGDPNACSNYRVKRESSRCCASYVMKQADEFSIGVLSERSGVNIETIRYYEKIGVMPKPARSAGGYLSLIHI